MTVLSRVAGLVRDICLAQLLGAKEQMDALLLALRIPNSARRLMAEGSFSQGFIPVLASAKTGTHQSTEVNELVRVVTGALLLVVGSISAIGMICAPYFVYIFAPGFTDNPPVLELTSTLLRITFPYLLFMSLCAMASAILNSYGKFAIPAFTPVLLNIAIIISAVWIAPYCSEPTIALAIAVSIAGILQIAIQVPALMSCGISIKQPIFSLRHIAIKRVAKLMWPTMLSSSLSQVSILVDTMIASTLAVGSLSWLYYADRLANFPIGVFGIALTTVTLPKLSLYFSSKSHQQFSKTAGWGIKIAWLILPASTCGLIFLAHPIIIVLFQHGKEFTQMDAYKTSTALMCYAIGLTPIIISKLLGNIYFAQQKPKVVMRATIIALVVNVACSLSLSRIFEHNGIALSTGIAAITSSLILSYTLPYNFIKAPAQGWKIFFVKITVALIAMRGVLFLSPDVAEWNSLSFSSALLTLILWMLGATTVYCGALYCLGFRVHHLK